MHSLRAIGLFFAITVAAPLVLADEPVVPAEVEAGGHEGAHGESAHGEGAEAHGVEHGGGHGGGEELNVADFSYKDEHKNPPLVLALVNFGLLLSLLGWKAVPALKSYWAKKSDSIRDGLQEGARLRKEAEAKLEEYTQRIKDVDREVDALIHEIRAEAEAEKERILAEARAQAEATRKAAEERIAADIRMARQEIEREVVAAAVAAAETMLRGKVMPADQDKLVSTFIASLDSGAASTTSPGRPS